MAEWCSFRRRVRLPSRLTHRTIVEINYETPEFGDLYDELPFWSAPFGLMLLERVRLRRGMTILDVGAGTGFLTIELAQRCGSEAIVIAVDP